MRRSRAGKRSRALTALAVAIVIGVTGGIAAADDSGSDYVPSDLTPYVVPDPAADAALAQAQLTGLDPKPTGQYPLVPSLGKASQTGSEPDSASTLPTFPGLTQAQAELQFNPTGDPNVQVLKCPDDHVMIIDAIPAPAGAQPAPPPPGGYDPPIDPCNPPEGP